MIILFDVIEIIVSFFCGPFFVELNLLLNGFRYASAIIRFNFYW